MSSSCTTLLLSLCKYRRTYREIPVPSCGQPLGQRGKAENCRGKAENTLKNLKNNCSFVGSTLPGCVTVVHFLMSVSPYLNFPSFCVVKDIPVWLLGFLRRCRQPHVICRFEQQILDWQFWIEITQSPLTALDFLIWLLHLGWEAKKVVLSVTTKELLSQDFVEFSRHYCRCKRF